MCRHRDTIKVFVPGSCRPLGWSTEDIDSCLVPIVRTLNAGGIYTMSCCCGHGRELGHIWLQDGRTLVIVPSVTKERLQKILDIL